MTARQGHKPIDLRLVDGFSNMVRPGDFFWSETKEGRRMHVAVPATSRQSDTWTLSDIPVSRSGGGKDWEWDGIVDKPTISPSLDVKGIWHGFIRNGKLVEA